MVMTGAYPQRLGERLRVESAPAIVTRSLRNADMAVTELRCDHPSPAIGDLIQQKMRFSSVCYSAIFRVKNVGDGKRAPVRDLRAGESTIYD
jgi:AraC family transcriptional regulator